MPHSLPLEVYVRFLPVDFMCSKNTVGARQLVRGLRPAGTAPSGKRGRRTPVLAHQLASASEYLVIIAAFCQKLKILFRTAQITNQTARQKGPMRPLINFVSLGMVSPELGTVNYGRGGRGSHSCAFLNSRSQDPPEC